MLGGGEPSHSITTPETLLHMHLHMYNTFTYKICILLHIRLSCLDIILQTMFKGAQMSKLNSYYKILVLSVKLRGIYTDITTSMKRKKKRRKKKKGS